MQAKVSLLFYFLFYFFFLVTVAATFIALFLMKMIMFSNLLICNEQPRLMLMSISPTSFVLL